MDRMVKLYFKKKEARSLIKEKEDLRYQRTKKAIIEALVHLLKKKNFEQISVQNICQEADISRSGFYLHYLDKYDLVEKYQLELLDKVGFIKAIDKQKSRAALMLEAITLLANEGKLLALLISDHGSVEIQNKIKSLMQESVGRYLQPFINIELQTEAEKRYFLSFFSNAIFGSIQEWVNQGQRESPAELFAILNRFITFDFVWKE